MAFTRQSIQAALTLGPVEYECNACRQTHVMAVDEYSMLSISKLSCFRQQWGVSATSRTAVGRAAFALSAVLDRISSLAYGALFPLTDKPAFDGRASGFCDGEYDGAELARRMNNAIGAHSSIYDFFDAMAYDCSIVGISLAGCDPPLWLAAIGLDEATELAPRLHASELVALPMFSGVPKSFVYGDCWESVQNHAVRLGVVIPAMREALYDKNLWPLAVAGFFEEKARLFLAARNDFEKACCELDAAVAAQGFGSICAANPER